MRAPSVSTLRPCCPSSTTVPPPARNTALAPPGPSPTDCRLRLRPPGSWAGLQLLPELGARRSGETRSRSNGRAATTSSRELAAMVSPPPVGTATGVMLMTCRQPSTVRSTRNAPPLGHTASQERPSRISSQGDAAGSGAPVAVASCCALSVADKGDTGADGDGVQADNNRSTLASASVRARYLSL